MALSPLFLACCCFSALQGILSPSSSLLKTRQKIRKKKKKAIKAANGRARPGTLLSFKFKAGSQEKQHTKGQVTQRFLQYSSIPEVSDIMSCLLYVCVFVLHSLFFGKCMETLICFSWLSLLSFCPPSPLGVHVGRRERE